MNPQNTNWYVITGGPSSGKTTMLNMLAQRGYCTEEEEARHYINTKKKEGFSISEIRKNQLKFQMEVLRLQVQKEQNLNPKAIVFLDRAIPDTAAYFDYLQLPYNDYLKNALQLFNYKKVFLLDRLPLIPDYARLEDENAQIRIHQLLIKTYQSRKAPIVHVPVLSPEKRLDFMLAHLE